MSGVAAGSQLLGRRVRNIGADGKQHEGIVLAVYMEHGGMSPRFLIASEEGNDGAWSKVTTAYATDCDVMDYA